VLTPPYAQSPLSIISSNASQNPPTPHFSVDQLVYLLADPTSSIELKHGYSKLAKTCQSTQGIQSAKVLQSQQSQQVSPKIKLNYSVDGKVTQWTSTSTRSINLPFNNECLISIQKSSPRSTPTLSLASSPTSLSIPTLSNPMSTTDLACRVHRISAVLSHLRH